MVLALPDFFQIMLKIMLGFENYARFCKVCFSSMKHKTCQNYNFFAPIKHNCIFNMFWHFVACGSGSKDRSNLYFWGVPSPLDDDQRSIAVTIDRPWKWPKKRSEVSWVESSAWEAVHIFGTLSQGRWPHRPSRGVWGLVPFSISFLLWRSG